MNQADLPGLERAAQAATLPNPNTRPAEALALLLRKNDGAMRTLTLLAAIAIAISGAIGVFHAGVEYGLWQGLTTCSTGVTGPITLDDIMAAPITRCDVPQWTLAGISLAGFNAIFSAAAAALVLTLLRRGRTSAA